MVTGGAHVGPILPPGGFPVLIGGMPCPHGRHGCVGPRRPRAGSFTVLIKRQPAARFGDMTAHGGAIVMGFPTVLIDETGREAGRGGPGNKSRDSGYGPVSNPLCARGRGWGRQGVKSVGGSRGLVGAVLKPPLQDQEDGEAHPCFFPSHPPLAN
ncbi:MAG: PAAR domain-containing protein, partial [Singulisphaera sp.]